MSTETGNRPIGLYQCGQACRNRQEQEKQQRYSEIGQKLAAAYNAQEMPKDKTKAKGSQTAVKQKTTSASGTLPKQTQVHSKKTSTATPVKTSKPKKPSETLTSEERRFAMGPPPPNNAPRSEIDRWSRLRGILKSQGEVQTLSGASKEDVDKSGSSFGGDLAEGLWSRAGSIGLNLGSQLLSQVPIFGGVLSGLADVGAQALDMNATMRGFPAVTGSVRNVGPEALQTQSVGQAGTPTPFGGAAAPWAEQTINPQPSRFFPSAGNNLGYYAAAGGFQGQQTGYVPQSNYGINSFESYGGYSQYGPYTSTSAGNWSANGPGALVLGASSTLFNPSVVPGGFVGGYSAGEYDPYYGQPDYWQGAPDYQYYQQDWEV